MAPQIKVDGVYISLTEWIKTHDCCWCGTTRTIALTYVPSNNSIQLRCPECNHYFGCLKYEYTGDDNAAAS